MEREFDNFERAWRKSFENHRVAPSKSVWDNLDGYLSGKQKRKQKIFDVTRKTAAVIAFVLLALGKDYVPSYFTTPFTIIMPENRTVFLNSSETNDKTGHINTLQENIPTFSPRQVSNSIYPIASNKQPDTKQYISPKSLTSIVQPARFYKKSSNSFNGINHDRFKNHLSSSYLQEPTLNADSQSLLLAETEQSPLQQKDPSDNKKNLWLSANITPLQVNQQVSYNNQSFGLGSENLLTPIASNPSQSVSVAPELSYQWGMQMGYSPAKKVKIEVGVQYAKHQLNIQASDKVAFLQAIEPSYNITTANHSSQLANFRARGGVPLIQAGSFQNSLEYLQFPAKISYHFHLNKWSIGIGGGIAGSILLNNELKSLSESINLPEQNNTYKNWNWMALAEVPITCQVSDHISVSLSPQYQRFLSSITNESSQVDAQAQSVGVATSLQYYF